MKVSIIGGTGPQGLGIAERLAIAGVDVIVGSRKEEKALDVVAKAKEDLSDYDLSNIRMRRETNGGAMYDLGCYTASMITWLLGRQPDEVKACADFSPEGIDLMTTAIFTYKDGIRAMMNCGMVLATDASKRIDQLRIEGTEGSIRSTGEFNGCGEMTYTVIRNGAEETKTVTVPQNYCLETEQLGRCILDGEKPHVTAQFTVANLTTIGKVLKEIGY